jgi:phosphate transport system protein
MPRPFHAQLQAIEDRVCDMAHQVKSNVLEGVHSLMTMDAEMAVKVEKRADALNRMDVEIERDLLDLLALHQPVAKDLRAIGASLKIITYLDRIGRYGYDIARVAIAVKEEGKGHVVPPPPSFPFMAKRATGMLDLAIQAYKDQDAAKARQVGPMDDEIDALNDQAFRQCITYMMENPRAIGPSSHYILVARHLERVGDNACKIAEKALYMATGERRLQV